MRPVNVSLSYTHLYITFPVHVLPVPSPRRGASQCTCFSALQFEPRRALYFEQTAIFRQSLGRPLTGLIRLLKPRQTQDFPGMKLPTRIFQDPPPTIFPGRKNPALSSKLSSGTFPETPSPTNILTTQTWLVPEGSGLEDFPGMVSWEIPGRGHFPGYF